MKDVIIAIGSNTNAVSNMTAARNILRELLVEVRFTEAIWTQPVPPTCSCRPSQSTKRPDEQLTCLPNNQTTKRLNGQYLNALAFGCTSLPLPHLQAKLKQIEESLGDGRGQHSNGTVNIDLDLLLYDGQRLKEKDWERPYVQQLLHTRLSPSDQNNLFWSART